MNDLPDAPRKKPITDSPWYWVYLFCTAGTIALLLAGPKFVARQSQIERNYEARQYAAHQVAKRQPSMRVPDAAQATVTRVTLWPLYVVLACVLSVAWFNLWRRHRRGRTTTQSSPPQNGATA